MSRTIRANDPTDGRYYGGPTGRDKKPFGKPVSWYKKMERQQRRAREKQALRNGDEPPVFKKTDEWEWL